MVDEATGGTGTLVTDGTEQNLFTLIGNLFYGGYIDLTALASGDTVVVREYHRIKSGGALLPSNTQTFTGARPTDKKVLEFPMKPNNFGYQISVQKTPAGPARSLDFEFFEV